MLVVVNVEKEEAMMRKLPDCSKCGEDELYLYSSDGTFVLACAECGWNSGIVTVADGQSLDDAIAAAVGKAKEPMP